MSPIKKIRDFFRRVIGTEQIYKLQLKQYASLQESLQRTMISSMIHSVNGLTEIDLEGTAVDEFPNYRRAYEILSLICPMQVKDAGMKRIGGNNDGGYVMLDEKLWGQVDAAYSFGVAYECSWDEAVAAHGIKIYMYDHTVTKPPKNNPRFNFVQSGITGFKTGERLKTLSECLADNHHQSCENMILKIDIEDCEWDVFDQVEGEVINQFSQIVIEFHSVLPAIHGVNYEKVKRCLEKINLTHQSIHIHANNYSMPLSICGLTLADSLEVSYVRKKDYGDRFLTSNRIYPTEHDRPNDPHVPDIVFGNISSRLRKVENITARTVPGTDETG